MLVHNHKSLHTTWELPEDATIYFSCALSASSASVLGDSASIQTVSHLHSICCKHSTTESAFSDIFCKCAWGLSYFLLWVTARNSFHNEPSQISQFYHKHSAISSRYTYRMHRQLEWPCTGSMQSLCSCMLILLVHACYILLPAHHWICMRREYKGSLAA